MNNRLKELKDKLNSMKLSGMIVSTPNNVKYLTGLEEEGYLIISNNEIMFITDSRYIESVNSKLTLEDEIVAYDRAELSQYDYENVFEKDCEIGFEENFVTYSMYKKYLNMFQVNLVETDSIIENIRVMKDKEEIDNIRMACKITEEAFDYVIHNIKEGMTEKDVAFELEKEFLKRGADGLAFESIVAASENSSKPHAVPSDRLIKKGDIVQFDIGAKYHGYCADFSRVIFIDEMNEKVKNAYDFILEEQMLLRTSLKDGSNIKLAIKDRETDFKLKNYAILHAFGHGVGMDIHEIPVLSSRKDAILRENSIIAIEPGVYFPGQFGIRIEDTFLVSKMSCDSLTNYTREYNIVKLLK